MSYGIQTAIECAVEEAQNKKDHGHLYYADQDQEDHDWSQGDPETVYSIILLYADDENDDGTWEDQIRDALFEQFEEYF